MPCYPKCPYSKTYSKCQLIELWYEAEKSGQSDVWKKAISERWIYASGRKKEHVAMGWIFSIPSNPGKLSVRQSMCDQFTF